MTERRTKPYTVTELAEHWQCSTTTIYDLIKRHAQGKPGGLPAFTLGGRLWRIRPEVVEQWQGVKSTRRETTDGLETVRPDA